MANDFRDPHPLPAGVERPEKVSMSALRHFDACPYSAALYWKYRGGVGSHPMDRGSAFHLWAELLHRKLLEDGTRQVEGEIGRDLMGQVIEQNPSLVLPAHEQEALRLMAFNATECISVDPDSLYALETMYEARVAGFTLRGRVDRADFAGGVLEITDWKTSKYVPAQEKVQDHNPETGSKVTGPEAFQLAVYALLLVYGRPEGEPDAEPLRGKVREVNAGFEYPRFRTGETLLRRSAHFTHTDLEDFARVLQAHLAKIDQGFADRELPAISGSHCGRCPSPRECPIPAHLREVLPPRDTQEAESLFALHNDLEKRKKWVQEGLKQFSIEHGPLFYGDQVIDLVRVDREGSVSVRFTKERREKWEARAEKERSQIEEAA